MVAQRYDPGTEPDRPDYRHCRPALACEGLIFVGGLDGKVWSPGRIHVWQHRPWGMPKHVGPDGWWAWGEWYPSPNRRWGGWLHESEVGALPHLAGAAS